MSDFDIAETALIPNHQAFVYLEHFSVSGPPAYWLSVRTEVNGVTNSLLQIPLHEIRSLKILDDTPLLSPLGLIPQMTGLSITTTEGHEYRAGMDVETAAWTIDKVFAIDEDTRQTPLNWSLT